MDRDKLTRIINSSPRALCLALTTLHARQTPDEQRRAATHHRNARGFNAHDAPVLSQYANFVAAGSRLTAKQRGHARALLEKYAGQLLGCGVDWEQFRDPGEVEAMTELAMELTGGPHLTTH